MQGGTAAVLVAVFSQIGLSMVQQGIPAVEPALQHSFHMALPILGTLSTAISLGSASALIPMGKMVDRWGARRMLMAGIFVAALLLLAVTLSPTLIAIEIGLILFGMVAAVIPTGGVTVVFHTVPPERRGLALGIRQASVSVGAAVADMVFPPIDRSFGWQIAFVVTIIPLAISLLLALAMPKTSPVVPRRQVAPRTVRPPFFLAASAFLLGVAQWTTLAYLAVYMAHRLHLPLVDGVPFIAIAQISSLIARIGWGHVSDRYFAGARRPLLKLIAAIVVVNSLGLILVSPHWSLLAAYTLSALTGISVLSWNGLMATLAVETIPDDPGQATGQIIMAIFLGGAIGAPLIGWVASHFAHLSITWAITASCAIAAYGLLAKNPKRHESSELQNTRD